MVRAGAAVAASGAILSFAATAQAQRPADLGIGAPSGAMGVQLFNWSQYLGNGAGEIVCDATSPPTSPSPSRPRRPRRPDVSRASSRTCSRVGSRTSSCTAIRAIRSLAGTTRRAHPGHAGPEDARRWLRSPLPQPSRQPERGDLGQRDHRGEDLGQDKDRRRRSRRTPVHATDPATHITNAQRLNRLGKRSVEAGVGPAYFHNHASSFSRPPSWTTASSSPMWQVLMERTEPRWVKGPDRPRLGGVRLVPHRCWPPSTLLTNFTNPPTRT